MRTLMLCGLIAAIAAPVQAGEARPSKDIANGFEVTVDYSDLDLERSAGADVLLVRIKKAARAVCGELPDIRNIKANSPARKSCVATSMAKAVDKVGSPLVTARFERSRPGAMLAARRAAENPRT